MRTSPVLGCAKQQVVPIVSSAMLGMSSIEESNANATCLVA